MPDDSEIWEIFRSPFYKIPLFPYRMQAVALWEEATNWRVLQASAHQDIKNSRGHFEDREIEYEEKVLGNVRHGSNIFNYCVEWSKQRIRWTGRRKGSRGVVIETVRTFLAEWIVTSGRESDWKPEIPKNGFEFDLGEIKVELGSPDGKRIERTHGQLIWICQRELQRRLAKLSKTDENFSSFGYGCRAGRHCR